MFIFTDYISNRFTAEVRKIYRLLPDLCITLYVYYYFNKKPQNLRPKTGLRYASEKETLRKGTQVFMEISIIRRFYIKVIDGHAPRFLNSYCNFLFQWKPSSSMAHVRRVHISATTKMGSFSGGTAKNCLPLYNLLILDGQIKYRVQETEEI